MQDLGLRVEPVLNRRDPEYALITAWIVDFSQEDRLVALVPPRHITLTINLTNTCRHWCEPHHRARIQRRDQCLHLSGSVFFIIKR